jgi:hypothetical protein
VPHALGEALRIYDPLAAFRAVKRSNRPVGRRRSAAREDEVDEGAYLCRWQMPRGMIGIILLSPREPRVAVKMITEQQLQNIGD